MNISKAFDVALKQQLITAEDAKTTVPFLAGDGGEGFLTVESARQIVAKTLLAVTEHLPDGVVLDAVWEAAEEIDIETVKAVGGSVAGSHTVVTPVIASVTTTEIGYGRRSEAVIRGRFRHNEGTFAVFVTTDGHYSLTTLSTVIQSKVYGSLGQTGPLPEAKAGDLIEVDGAVYRIMDDCSGYDPRLVAADPTPMV